MFGRGTLECKGDESVHSRRPPGTGKKIKFTGLLLLGLALLPFAALADQAPVSVCVNALEQVETLQIVAPVYMLTGVQKRRFLADADRMAELARLKAIRDYLRFSRYKAVIGHRPQRVDRENRGIGIAMICHNGIITLP